MIIVVNFEKTVPESPLKGYYRRQSFRSFVVALKINTLCNDTSRLKIELVVKNLLIFHFFGGSPLGVPLGLFVKKWYLKVGLAGYDILNDITKVQRICV